MCGPFGRRETVAFLIRRLHQLAFYLIEWNYSHSSGLKLGCILLPSVTMTGGNTLCLVWVFSCNLLCFGFESTMSVFMAPMNWHLYRFKWFSFAHLVWDESLLVMKSILACSKKKTWSILASLLTQHLPLR